VFGENCIKLQQQKLFSIVNLIQCVTGYFFTPVMSSHIR